MNNDYLPKQILLQYESVHRVYFMFEFVSRHKINKSTAYGNTFCIIGLFAIF